MALFPDQESLLELPIRSTIFLQGPAGTGKTTGATHRLTQLLDSGIPAHQILVYVPQRSLALPYLEMTRAEIDTSQSLLTSMTLGGLARRMVDLFWPIISHDLGVGEPNKNPQFLTLETAQYHMAHIVRPLLEEQGYFASLTINRNRIYSQILDNLNKSAIVGFPYQQVGERLKSAWVGDIDQLLIYDQVQDCINRFRVFCLENNLLDFSLQVETFAAHLWPSTLCRNHLTQTYRHLIADNIEEDAPVAHDILRDWLPEFESALLIFDEGAGYRFFLGADVHSAISLKQHCKNHLHFSQNKVSDPGILELKAGFEQAINKLKGLPENQVKLTKDSIIKAFEAPETNPRYFPGMVTWTVEKIEELVNQGTPPGEIVVLAPFMPDVLRFTLSNQLSGLGIPNQSHRPSRSLRDEPAVQTALTLATVAFPQWNMLPQRINLAFALMQAIDGLDLVRSQLLTAYIYISSGSEFLLKPFESVPLEARSRITYHVGERYDHLRSWLLKNQQDEDSLALDFFLNRLFGEVLSQPGYGFHQNLESGNTIGNLIESVQKFRWAIDLVSTNGDYAMGKEYIQMVLDGVISAQYLQSWEFQQDAVFLSPAYTFLIRNRPVDYQFWLDIGSPSWYQRLDQPLTQAYVLNRNWDRDAVWDATRELEHVHQTLERLSLGLLHRCRKKLFVGMSELDVRGYENRGLLIRTLQHILQNMIMGER